MKGDRAIKLRTYIAVMALLFLWGLNGNVRAESGGTWINSSPTNEHPAGIC